MSLDREMLECDLAELPILQYEFIDTDILCFSEKVRHICRTECPMYGKTWACPPGVGTPDACRERCLAYKKALLLTTAIEVHDVTNLEETLATRNEHEEVVRQAAAFMQKQVKETYVLSTQACAICAECSYPDAPCRFPDKMFPCVESHCIVVTELAEKFGIEFICGGNTVVWFSIIFYEE